MSLPNIENQWESMEPHACEAIFECPVCWCCFPAGYQGWRIPHPVAEEMNLEGDESVCWVCSDTCQSKWCDTNWEEIEEYEKEQEA